MSKDTDITARTLVLDAGDHDGDLLNVKAGGASVFKVASDGTLTFPGDIALGDDQTIAGDLAVTGTMKVGTSEAVGEKGRYLSSVLAVAVPTIAADKDDGVVVDVSSVFTMQPAVGDVVIAIPQEALPTSALLEGAYVTATDTVTLAFGTLEGAAVTGANKNFKFYVIDLT